MQRVALDLERRRDAMRRREVDAVVVEIVGLRAIAPVRRRGDLLSQLGLANVHPTLPAGEHRIDAVFAEQLGEFAQAIGIGVDLRLDVAPGDFRRAGIGADERFHVAIELPAAQDLERRDQQSLLKQIGGVAAVGARDLAAEIRLVGDVADEAEEPLTDEQRRDDGDVGGMVLAGLIGMIDDESIARLGRIAEAPADLVHLRCQRPDMQRLRDALRHQAAYAVEDGEGEILAFLDYGGIARAQHVERELARDLQGGLIDDFEVDGVQIGAPRHPDSSCLTGTGRVGKGATLDIGAWAKSRTRLARAATVPQAILPTLRLTSLDMSSRSARNTPPASACR